MILPTKKPTASTGWQPKQKKEIKAFPIWAVMLLMSIGMCFLALAALAIIFNMSIWITIICIVVALKAFNTPWIYNRMLRKINEIK